MSPRVPALERVQKLHVPAAVDLAADPKHQTVDEIRPRVRVPFPHAIDLIEPIKLGGTSHPVRSQHRGVSPCQQPNPRHRHFDNGGHLKPGRRRPKASA
jgi:hypothetical protein